MCICCIKYSEIIKIKYCHRDERYETTVLFLLLIVRFLFDTDYVKHVRIAHAVNLSTMEHTMVYPCNDAYRYYFRCQACPPLFFRPCPVTKNSRRVRRTSLLLLLLHFFFTFSLKMDDRAYTFSRNHREEIDIVRRIETSRLETNG